jgi:DNA topoisomerase IA
MPLLYLFLLSSPHQTMHIAEMLYQSGFLSYPRTESTAYPKSFDFVSVLKSHTRRDLVRSMLSIMNSEKKKKKKKKKLPRIGATL